MDATENTLGLLRELPPEVSLDQVGHMVAAFPLAAAASASWTSTINLNSILMTTAGSLVVGGAFYFLSVDASTAHTTERIDPTPVVAFTEETAAPEEPAVVFEMPNTRSETKPPTIDPPLELLEALPPALSIDPSPVPRPKTVVVAAPPSAPEEKFSTPGVERTFDLRNFATIELHGHLYVVVEQGDFSVRAFGEEDALERLHLEVGGGILSISGSGPAQDKTNCKGVNDTKVIVRLPELTSAEVYGSGTLDIGEMRHNGTLSLDLQGSGDLLFQQIVGLRALSISLTGSGDVAGEAEVIGLTTINVSGSGDVHIAGTTREIDLSVIGSGDLDAGGLDARQGKVQVQGSGDIHVNCSGPLEQHINGSGDIHLTGNAGDNRQRGVDGNTY